jgi:hypothetical protein
MPFSNGGKGAPTTAGSSGQGMIAQSPNGISNGGAGANAQLFIPNEMKMATMDGGSIAGGLGSLNSKKASMSSQQQPRSQSVVTPGNAV